MKPRITICVREDGSFEMLLNEAGRDQMVLELQRLDREWDHFHLDHFDDPDIADCTDIPLSVRPYNEGDKVFENGKVLFRPDEWDAAGYPHLMKA